MYRKLSLWEGKLEFLRRELEDIKNFDTSWYDIEQKSNYKALLIRTENKVHEYEELVNYLREEK